MRHINWQEILREVTFKTSRSRGKGGQHVNKTESRVSLFFDIKSSELLTDEEKTSIIEKIKGRLNEGEILQIDVEESRSQYKNKDIALKRLVRLLRESMRSQKKRKPSKPNKAAIRKRLEAKKKQSEKKQNRRKYRLL